MTPKILVFIPTYEERENVTPMCEQIMALPLPLDLLFVDDGSPDGTGEELDRLASLYPRVTVKHRSGKLGIGSAHQVGIAYAYQHDYDVLVTLDCDFTHEPKRIPDLIAAREGYQVVLGSRFLQAESLPGWTFFRRFLTNFGHFLTRNLLRLKFDATGAFRLYDLRKIPAGIFGAVQSRSYSFFFESLFVIDSNGFKIKEIPIVLPSRTYGHSKLSFFEAYKSALFLMRLSLERWLNPGRFKAARPADRLQENLSDPQGWAPYWQQKKEISSFVYEMIAGAYRNLFLRPNLNKMLLATFGKGNALLHAGCGSGRVDTDLQSQFRITAIDISSDALDLYSRYNPEAFRIEQASILDLPCENESFDGVYNLGVMEHFTPAEIGRILSEFHRVLRPEGKIVLFWPHRRASSVLILKAVRWFSLRVWNRDINFHPPEISLLESEKQARVLLLASGFDLVQFHLGLRDGYVQAVLVGRKAISSLPS